ncbi:MAG: hypothetical protein DRI77_10090 [Chloroflexi bacterium]|nr:MAG: hypothetical protein DRI77_10090 [Chloroflexota bacterium]
MAVLSNLSLILLAVEAFIIALIPLILCGGLVYGLWWLQRHENLPSWLRLAQAYLALGRAYVELAMRAVIKPILLLHSAVATAQNWLGAITKFAKGGNR